MGIGKQKFKVILELTEDQLGTLPKDKEIYTNYIATKVAQTQASVESEDLICNVSEKGWTTFMCDDKGVYILNYMIQGFIREAGWTLKDALKIKQIKAKLEKFVFITTRKVYFKDSEEFLQEVDGVLERPLRGMTAQGPIVSLVKSDFINSGRTLEFELLLLDNSEIKTETLKEIFEYGELKGLGQFRNGGYGTFKVVKFEKLK